MKMNASRSPLQKGNIKNHENLNTIYTKTGTAGNRADHFWKSRERPRERAVGPKVLQRSERLHGMKQRVTNVDENGL